MARWPLPALISVYLSAVAIRLAPLIWPGLGYTIWGSDTGEYYSISSALAADGTIDAGAYQGWGFAYPYFPGMYFFTAALEWCGLDAQTALLWGMPAISALVVFPAYLIAVEITRDRAVGILSSAIVGLSVFHVYATSHPIPGGIGSVLGLFCIYLLLRSYKDARAMVPLLMLAGALVLTHHLTAFVILAVVAFSNIVRLIVGHRDGVAGRCRLDVIFMGAMLAMMLLYWGLMAAPFAERIVGRGTGVPLWALGAGGFAGLALLWWLADNRDRLIRYTYWPGRRSAGVPLRYFTVTVGIVLGATMVAIIFTIPGTDIEVSGNSAFFILPLGIFAALSSVGATFLRRMEDGFLVYAWASAFAVLSFLSVAVQSEELVVYRYSQYMMEPVAIMMAVGMAGLPHTVHAWREDRPVVDAIGPDTPRSSLARVRLIPRTPGGRPGATSAVILLSVTVLLTAAATNYPPRDVTGGFEEGTTPGEMDGVQWSRDELAGGMADDGAVLTDHRMSSMIFGYAGMDASWDQGGEMLHSDELPDRDSTIDAPAGERVVQYALISADMEEGTALKQWETAEPLDGEAREKYDRGMWKVFDNGEVAIYSWPE